MNAGRALFAFGLLGLVSLGGLSIYDVNGLVGVIIYSLICLFVGCMVVGTEMNSVPPRTETQNRKPPQGGSGTALPKGQQETGIQAAKGLRDPLHL